jgi:integrase
MEDLAKYPGLVRRSGSQNWYFKARVPTDLVALYDGKTQIWRSLGTADRSEAERVWYGVSATIRDEFDKKRETLWQPARGGVRRMSRAEQIRKARRDASEAGETRKPLTHVAANELARTWFVESVNIRSLADPPDRDEAIADLDEERSTLLDPGHPDTLISTQQAADVLLERFKFAGVPGEPSYEHLTGALRMAMLEMNRIGLERLSSGPGDAIRAALFAGPSGMGSPAAAFSTVSTNASNLSIQQAADRYWEDELPNRSNTDQAELTKVRGWLNLIIEFFGPDNALSAIEPDSVERYLRLLERFPANRTKMSYAKLSPTEIADQAEKNGNKKLSYRTRQHYTRELRRFVKWCRRRRFLLDDPMDLMPKQRRYNGDQTDREYYTVEELKIIFNAPLYTGCRDDEHNFNKPGDNHPRRGRFWVPLLGLYTGAREGELCQLRVADVRETSAGTPYLDFGKREAGMSGKTAAATRSTPIHQELVSIGFLKFVEEQKRKGETNLFPELLQEGRKPSDLFYRRYTSFLKALKLKRPGLVFHSYRHTVRSALKRVDVIRRLGGDLDHRIDLMFGWAGGKEMRDHYASGAYPVDELEKLMKQVRFPGLDLSHLYRSDG